MPETEKKSDESSSLNKDFDSIVDQNEGHIRVGTSSFSRAMSEQDEIFCRLIALKHG